jgi:muramoyltetrapeptide carboxypeptidase
VAASHASPALVKPRAIAPGATLGIAAPGGPVNPDRLAEGCELLRAAGYRTLHRDDVTARRGYLAGEDARRAKELMELAGDPRVDAIVCARGGYGCDRILHLLDARALRAAAKPIVGYSDVTALLLWLRRRAGLVGFHGPMLERGADADPAAQEALLAQLAGSAPLPVVLRGRGLGGSVARGRLVGGSLTLVAASLGTPWEVQTRGAILLLEEVNEAPYRVDRMLQQLRAAGKLAGVVGVGVGDVSTCVDERYATGVLDVVEEAVRPLGVPLVALLPFGHVRANAAWPVGVQAELDGERGELRILEHGVRATR